MDSLARVLLPYRDVIGNVAGILTIAQFLSGCFTCNKIRLKGSSEGFSALQFVFGCGLTILQLKYSQMLRSAPLIRTSSYALAICFAYSGCYLFYTPRGKRNDFWKLVMRTILLVGGALLYAGFENPALVKDRFGLLVTILTLSYIGLPLLQPYLQATRSARANGILLQHHIWIYERLATRDQNNGSIHFYTIWFENDVTSSEER